MPLLPIAIPPPAAPSSVVLRLRPSVGKTVRFAEESLGPDNGEGRIRLGETIALAATAVARDSVTFRLSVSEPWGILPPALAARVGEPPTSRRPSLQPPTSGRFDPRWRYLPARGETGRDDTINVPMFVTFEFPPGPVRVGSRWTGRYGRPFGLPATMRVTGLHRFGDDTAVAIGFLDRASANDPSPIDAGSRYVVSARDGMPLLFEIRSRSPGEPPFIVQSLHRLDTPGIESLAARFGFTLPKPPDLPPSSPGG